MNILRAVLVFVALLALAAASFLFFYHRGDEVVEGVGEVAGEVGEFIEGHAELIMVPLGDAARRKKPPPRVIYLNREGALLSAGTQDDASLNVSSIIKIAGLNSFDVPAYTGSNKRWNDIKQCIQKQFKAYDVQIVDRRPVKGDYLMVMMGGKPGALKKVNTGKGQLLGLTPFNGQTVHDAVVLIFTEEIGHRNTRTCETVAHEIAHAYGVDHSRLCSDVMTYQRSCVKLQTFRDKDADCGEYDSRPCKNGRPKQNSHEVLLSVLGAAQ